MTKEQLRAFREFKERFVERTWKGLVFKSNKKKLDYTLYLMDWEKTKVGRVRVGFEEENGKIVAITLTSIEKKLEGKPQSYRFAFEKDRFLEFVIKLRHLF